MSNANTTDPKPGTFFVEKAWTLTRNCRQVQDGWDLLLATGGAPDWCSRWATKREALAAAARCNTSAKSPA